MCIYQKYQHLIKKRVFLDWIIDLFFDRDVSRLKLMKHETEKEYKELDEVDDVW